MIYVVTCEESIIKGRYPFGYFHSYEDAQKRIDFEQGQDKKNNRDRDFKIYEISDLTDAIDYTKLKYQYRFKAILTMGLLPPHDYKINISDAHTEFRDQTELYVEYAENLIVFHMVLFENDPDEVKHIVKIIADEVFELKSPGTRHDDNAIKAVNINGGCGGYANLLAQCINKHKERG